MCLLDILITLLFLVKLSDVIQGVEAEKDKIFAIGRQGPAWDFAQLLPVQIPLFLFESYIQTVFCSVQTIGGKLLKSRRQNFATNNEFCFKIPHLL